eukprot:scaffold404770_cov43-Prasinocladus_malaysianus.AAC.1
MPDVGQHRRLHLSVALAAGSRGVQGQHQALVPAVRVSGQHGRRGELPRRPRALDGRPELPDLLAAGRDKPWRGAGPAGGHGRDRGLPGRAGALRPRVLRGDVVPRPGGDVRGHGELLDGPVRVRPQRPVHRHHPAQPAGVHDGVDVRPAPAAMRGAGRPRPSPAGGPDGGDLAHERPRPTLPEPGAGRAPLLRSPGPRPQRRDPSRAAA